MKQKKYTIEVNGEEFEVIIKDSQEINPTNSTSADSTATAEKVDESKPAKSSNKDAGEDSTPGQTSQERQVMDKDEDMVAVKAPMTGKILTLHYDIGDKVKKNDVIITMEAMKMETEISTPASGVVKDILTQESENCESGDTLALIGEEN